MAALEVEAAFHGPQVEWVDLKFNETLDGWDDRQGAWSNSGQGELRHRLEDERSHILCRSRFGSNYEIRGEIFFSGTKFSDYKRKKGFAIRLEFFGAEPQYLELYPGLSQVYSGQGERKPMEVALGQSSTFLVQVLGQELNFYLNGQILMASAPLDPILEPEKSTFGFWSNFADPEEEVWVRGLQVRRLVERPESPELTLASALRRADALVVQAEFENALRVLKSLPERDLDDKRKRLLQLYRRSTGLRQILSNGDWLDIFSAVPDMGDWEPVHGHWHRQGNTVIGECEKGGNFLLCPLRLTNFEVETEMECSQPSGGRNCAVVFGYDSEAWPVTAAARYGWRAWTLEKNFDRANQHPTLEIPEGPLPVRIRHWDGHVQLLFREGLVARQIFTEEISGFIGLGGHFTEEGAIVRFHKFKVRVPKERPSDLGQATKEVMY